MKLIYFKLKCCLLVVALSLIGVSKSWAQLSPDFTISDTLTSYLTNVIMVPTIVDDSIQYDWYVDSFIVASYNRDTFNYTYHSFGVHEVYAIAYDSLTHSTVYGTTPTHYVYFPAASFTTSPESGFVPLTISTTNSSDSLAGVTYEWYVNDTLQYTGFTPPSFTFNAYGILTLKLIETNTSEVLDIYNFGVNAISPSVYFSVNYSTTYAPVSATITNSSTMDYPNSAMRWYVDNVLVSTDSAGFTYTFAEVKDYEVRGDLVDTTTSVVLATYTNSVYPSAIGDVYSSSSESCTPANVLLTAYIYADTTNTGAALKWHVGDSTYTDTNDTISVTINSDSTYVYYELYNAAQDSLMGYSGKLLLTFNTKPSSIIASEQNPVCPGTTLSFSFDNNSYYYYYLKVDSGSWYSSSGYTFDSVGSHTVYADVFSSCGEDTLTYTVVVSSSSTNKPVFNIQTSFSASDSLCPNQSLSFYTDNYNNSYTWNFGDGTIDSVDVNGDGAFQHAYASVGDYVVEATTTNACGNSTSHSTAVHISSNQTLQMSLYSPTSICPGTAAYFYVISSGAAPVSVEWDFGDGSTATGTNAYNTYTKEGIYIVSVVAYNGCGYRTEQVDTVTVVKQNTYDNTISVPSFAVSPFVTTDSGTTVCAYRTNTYTISDYSYTYKWVFGSDTLTGYSVQYAFNNDTAAYKPVTVIATNACGNYNYSATSVYSSPNLTPTAEFRVVPYKVCPGGQVYFWDNRDDYEYDLGYSYIIDYGDGSAVDTFTNVTDTLSMTLAKHEYTSGTYPATFYPSITITNGCTPLVVADSVILSDAFTSSEAPFIYTANSASYKPMVDYSVLTDSNYNVFKVPVKWTTWSSSEFDNQFLIAVRYGGFTSSDEKADGYVWFTSDSIVTGDTVTVSLPYDEVEQKVGFKLGYYCNTNQSFTHKPEVYYMATNPNVDMKYGNKTPVYANPIVITDSLSGLCNNALSGTWSYKKDVGEYVLLEIDGSGSSGSYSVYLSADSLCVVPTSTLDEGYYSINGDTISLFNHSYAAKGETYMYPCFAYYTFTSDASSISFTMVADTCVANRPLYLNGRTFNVIKTPEYNGCPGDEITFQAEGGLTYLWNFGDGETSTIQYTTHAYTDTGLYKVTLVSTTGCGNDTSISYVAIGRRNLPDFSISYYAYDYSTPLMGTPVVFEPYFSNNFSSGESEKAFYKSLSYYWDFGDGYSSTEKSPLHSYYSSGSFTPSLTVSNGCGSVTITGSWSLEIDSSYYTCSLQPKYTYTIDSSRNASFQNLTASTSAEVYWDFGDGSYSTDWSPGHTYQHSGVYYVCMYVQDLKSYCTNYVCQEVVVGTVNCVADFNMVYNSTSKTVNLLNASTADTGTQYYVDFGDGSYATSADTSHTYTYDGIYSVCMYLYNETSACFSSKCEEVKVGNFDCEASFSFMVDSVTKKISITNSSANSTNAYWTFGDGGWSQEWSPAYTYQRDGLYSVCLYVYDSISGCYAEKCQDVTVGNKNCDLYAGFNYFINPDDSIVSFEDYSSGSVTGRFWNFGDGVTSTVQNPTHKYTKAGYYPVTFSIFDTVNGCSDAATNYIQIGTADCKAGFAYSVDAANLKASFFDRSRGAIAYRYYDFGDGNYSEQPDPVNQYAHAGKYWVYEVILDSTGTCWDYTYQEVQIGDVNCSAQFTYYTDSATNTVYLQSSSLGSSSQLYWILGDGTVSTENNPVHKFDYPGYYWVSLSTYDSVTYCMDYSEQYILVGSIGQDCRADFSYTLTGDSMKFVDLSEGDITYWYWAFGDGGYAEGPNPYYIFSSGGYYDVCLTVWNSWGIPNTMCKTIQYRTDASTACKADFTYQIDSLNRKVRFADKSLGNINKWTWDLGDNNVSQDQNFVHAYTDSSGYYEVHLTVMDTVNGCVSEQWKLLNVAMGNNGVQASFLYAEDNMRKKPGNYPVDFVGVSLGDAPKFKWRFKSNSKKANYSTGIPTPAEDSVHFKPRVVYSESGLYNVCFTVEDPITHQSNTKCKDVNVTAVDVPEQPATELSYVNSISNYPNPFSTSTTIKYSIQANSDVEICVYDVTGRKLGLIFRGSRSAGSYDLPWSARNLATGIYYLQMHTNTEILTTKVLITR